VGLSTEALAQVDQWSSKSNDMVKMPAIFSYGLRVMGYGLWVMGYGLWVRSSETLNSNPPPVPSDPLGLNIRAGGIRNFYFSNQKKT
jgi:hypothetical protein